VTAARTFEGRLRRAVDGIWNRGNLDLADAVLTADYINHGGLIPDLVRGPEAVKIAAVVARLAFPQLRVAVEDLVGDGARVAVRWTARADAAADPVAGVTFGRIAGDRIAESWTYWEGHEQPPSRRAAPRPNDTETPMPFWNARRSEKQTEELVQRMVEEWRVSAADARDYVTGRGTYLRLKDLKQPDELRQYQRTKRWGAAERA
jgi:hypothetical protein